MLVLSASTKEIGLSHYSSDLTGLQNRFVGATFFKHLLSGHFFLETSQVYKSCQVYFLPRDLTGLQNL